MSLKKKKWVVMMVFIDYPRLCGFNLQVVLKSKDYNINEVAKKVGYKHQSNFTRMFYKHFKVLPKDMKNF